MSTNATPSPATRVKKLRVFAGPNGSGKSSIYRLIAEQYNVGVYVNVGDLQSGLSAAEGLSLQGFLPSLGGAEFREFYDRHPLRLLFGDGFPFVVSPDGRLALSPSAAASPKASYAVSVLADYVRTRLLEASENLSFETVLSHPSKLSVMRQAKEMGYRVYLYYIGVASPEICRQRVALRVTQGGPDVPAKKIAERYERSLTLLKDAVALSDRAYLFDNTYSGASLKLEINQASEALAKEPQLPEWITRSLPALVPDSGRARKGGG